MKEEEEEEGGRSGKVRDLKKFSRVFSSNGGDDDNPGQHDPIRHDKRGTSFKMYLR